MSLKADAYTLDAVVDAGVPARVARTLMASGPRAVPVRALTAPDGLRRTDEPTDRYIWWPDALVLLADMTARGRLCAACLDRTPCACTGGDDGQGES